MMYYIPKLHHAIITTALLVLVLLLGARTQGKVLDALNVGAVIFAIITAVIMALIVVESLNERMRVMTEWMIAFGKLDDEARAAVAFAFPTMRYKMHRGEVRGMFEDTNVSIDTFRLFLQTSNSQYISPRRDWYTAEKPEWAWLEIQGWLLDNDYIIPESAAGSHSWLWMGNSHQHLTAYWMAGRRIPDLNRVYAYESTPPPPLKDVGGGPE